MSRDVSLEILGGSDLNRSCLWGSSRRSKHHFGDADADGCDDDQEDEDEGDGDRSCWSCCCR